MADKIQFDLHRDGCASNGYTLLIGQVDEKGYGHGYRIFGPKVCLLGNDRHLRTYEIGERDAREIFSYIRPLLGDEWLAREVTDNGRMPTICLSCNEAIPATEYVDHRRGCQRDVEESNARHSAPASP